KCLNLRPDQRGCRRARNLVEIFLTTKQIGESANMFCRKTWVHKPTLQIGCGSKLDFGRSGVGRAPDDLDTPGRDILHEWPANEVGQQHGRERHSLRSLL